MALKNKDLTTFDEGKLFWSN